MTRPGSVIFDLSFVRLLVRSVVPSDALAHCLAEHGITSEQLKSGDGHIPYNRAVRLMRAVRRDLNVPHLGLLMGSNLHLSMFGPLGVASLTHATIGAAQDEFMRHFRPLLPFCDWTLSVHGKWLYEDLTVVPGNRDSNEILVEALTLGTQNTIELLSNQRLVDSQVFFRRSAPSYAAWFHRLFSGEVHFGAEHDRFVVPAAVRELPNAFHDPALHRIALDRVRAQRANNRGDVLDGLVQRLTHAPLAPPPLAELAAEYGMSSRSLIRALRRRNTTYQALKDRVRRQYAAAALQVTSTTVDALAAEMGYHDASSFRRAFRRWFGCSPTAYRRRLAG